VRLAEAAQGVLGLAVEHTTARHDERLARAAQQRDGGGQLVLVRTLAARRPEARLEQALRIVVGFHLHVLAQGEGRGAALRRVGEHGHGAGEGGDELLGPGQPVEIARDRAQAVVGAHRAVREILDLLQDRVGPAAREHVARQQQQRQPVDVRDRGGRHQIGGTRTDRGGAGHRPAPPARLGVGDGGVRHSLLVMGAEGGQHAAHPGQRLAEASHVAVAEDGPDAAEERPLATADPRALRSHGADERLCHGQPDRAHVPLPIPAISPRHQPPPSAKVGWWG
jgi:hypothetical protein